MPKTAQKYLINVQIFSLKKAGKNFFNLAHKHIIKKGTKKENLALNTDKILYGKK